MHVKVTVEDIACGLPMSPSRCPLALAIKRVTDKPVSVRNTAVLIGDKAFDLPPAALVFRCDVDNHYPVKPMEFEL